jgi:hypothetical protein
LTALGWMDAVPMPTAEEVNEFVRQQIEKEC